MPDVRPINEKKYGISKHAFVMTRAFCLQYPEWKQELAGTMDSVKSIQITDMPVAHGNTNNPTEELAHRHVELMNKIELVEDTVMEAVGNNMTMYPYLLKYVTMEGSTYNQMQQAGMAFGKTLFYETRRKFYYLLAKKL